MRHLKAGRMLNRTSAHRQALLSNLVTALIHHERITTTLAKAKEARRVAEKMISLAKRGALHPRRNAARTIRDSEALRKLFAVLGPRFSSRNGGYTRIVKVGRRVGDAAPMAILELVERTAKLAPLEASEGPKDKKKATGKKDMGAVASKREAAPKPKEKKAKASGEAGAVPKSRKGEGPKQK